MEYISLMPPGSRIEPPIPPGNPMGLDLLDQLDLGAYFTARPDLVMKELLKRSYAYL